MSNVPDRLCSVGVEEELFLVEPATLSPTPCAEVLRSADRFHRARIVAEMCDGVVELVSPVCATAGEAVATLRDLRAGLLREGRCALLGTGVHPTLAFGDVRHNRSEHYDRVALDTRSLLRQTPFCGTHVHVGMPDDETTIAGFNGMRRWVPVLQALSANSPFWHGRDSGLEGARTVLNHSLPRSGLPRAFRDWADYRATVEELCRVAEVRDGASLWWDMRPHHRLGTLEVRAIDAQSSLDDLAALTALVHCLARHEATAGEPRSDPSPEVLAECSYRAIRDGLAATLRLDGGVHVGVGDLARHACDVAADQAAALGCAEELAGIERILEEGNGAVRQRRAFAAGGMPAVLELLRAETAGSGMPAVTAIA